MQTVDDQLVNLARPGEVLMGKYRVERVLGIGGMGVVVEARHLQLEDRVAIKFLLASMASNPEVVARFVREGRAATKIRSEHVVRVFDVGTLENGAPYMVMEFLEGSDLSHVVEQRGPMPLAQAVDWLLQACEALAEAHAAGIVHRDLKPANLFVIMRSDQSACIKVLDFGISKVNGVGPDLGITKTQAVMGSPRYMSPEQLRSSRSVDARSDIWALGTVLHELLAGAPPFDAETMPELCARILTEAPSPLRTVRPDLSPELEVALMGALQKDPAARYQNVWQFAAALAPFGTPAAQLSADRVARVLKVAPGALGQSDPNARRSNLPSFPPMQQALRGTAGPWAGSQPEVRPPSSGKGWIAATLAMALLLVVLGGVAAVAYSRRATTASSTSSSSALVAPPPAASIVPLVLPEPSAPATTSAASPADSAAPPPVASVTSTPRPTAAFQGGGHAPVSTVVKPAATKPKGTSNPFEDR